MAEVVYPPVIRTALTVFRLLGLRFHERGYEHMPLTGGAVIASNHVSYLDFALNGVPAWRRGHRLVRFMAKEAVFRNSIAGPLMRGMKHISVDRAAGAASYQNAVQALRDGELVGVFPEATISRSFELKDFKTGAVRMAAEAGVPIIPMIVWGSQRILTKDHPRDLTRGRAISITVGEPMYVTPEEDQVAATLELRERMTKLLEETIRNHPDQPEGDERWWIPRSYGGTAPTPEEATAMDAAEMERRAAKAAAKAAANRR